LAKGLQNIFSALVFMVLSVAVYIASQSIQTMTDMGVGPSFFPQVVSILMFIIALILCIQGVIIYFKEKDESESIIVFLRKNLLKVEYLNAIITAILFIAYVFAIYKFGFLPSSIIYLILHFLILSERRAWNIPLFIIIGVLFSIIVFYSFREGFSVRLPSM